MNHKCEKCSKYRDGCDGSDKLVVSDCFIEIQPNDIISGSPPPIPERTIEQEKETLSVVLSEPKSEKHRNFRRILERRLKCLLNDFRLIGNLGSGNYDYTQEDIDNLEQQIKAIYTKTMSKFKKVR